MSAFIEQVVVTFVISLMLAALNEDMDVMPIYFAAGCMVRAALISLTGDDESA